MSYASAVLNLTTESKLEASGNRDAHTNAHHQSQKTTAWSTPPPTLISAPDTDAGLISELESSKSEVEALKQQLSKMEEEKQAELKEIRGKRNNKERRPRSVHKLNAAKWKHELRLNA